MDNIEYKIVIVMYRVEEPSEDASGRYIEVKREEFTTDKKKIGYTVYNLLVSYLYKMRGFKK